MELYNNLKIYNSQERVRTIKRKSPGQRPSGVLDPKFDPPGLTVLGKGGLPPIPPREPRGPHDTPVKDNCDPLGRPLAPPWPPRAPRGAPRGVPWAPLWTPWFPVVPSVTLALFHAISRGAQYSDFAITKRGFNDCGGAKNDETALRDQKGTPWAPPGPPPSFRTGSGGGPGTTPKND